MKNLIRLRYLILFSLVISCTQDSSVDSEQLTGVLAQASSKQTVSIVGLGEISGTSTLHRNKNGITVNFKAEGLYPGAYTIWWVIWNNPQECVMPGKCEEADFATPVEVQVEVMYAGGNVVGNNGKGNFSAHLRAGDDSPESMNESFGFPSVGGLAVGNTYDAEVHVVLRTHGPLRPGLVNEQIGNYRGGCDAPFDILPFTEYPDEVGQCADIAAAIFEPAN